MFHHEVDILKFKETCTSMMNIEDQPYHSTLHSAFLTATFRSAMKHQDEDDLTRLIFTPSRNSFRTCPSSLHLGKTTDGTNGKEPSTLCASDLKTVGDGVREGFSWCNQNFSSGRRFTRHKYFHMG
ncbi:hypothetical protein M8J77_019803 [Diaphorina citri]|nr:hypothetical protein M8J77_019803 [Diaphorina citri]